MIAVYEPALGRHAARDGERDRERQRDDADDDAGGDVGCELLSIVAAKRRDELREEHGILFHESGMRTRTLLTSEPRLVVATLAGAVYHSRK